MRWYRGQPALYPKKIEGHWLNLGCGTDIKDGFINLDMIVQPDKYGNIPANVRKWNFEIDRNNGNIFPFPDDHFDYILMRDVLEHVPHRVPDRDGEFFLWLIEDLIRITRAGGSWEVISPCRPETIGAAGHVRIIDESTFQPWLDVGKKEATSAEARRCIGNLVTYHHENLRLWDIHDPLRFGRAVAKRLGFRVVK